MSTKLAAHRRASLFAYISLSLSLLQTVILQSIRIFATHPIADSAHSVALKRLLGITVLFGGLLAILSSLVGIIFDSWKLLAVVAFLVSLLCWFLSFLQTLV